MNLPEKATVQQIIDQLIEKEHTKKNSSKKVYEKLKIELSLLKSSIAIIEQQIKDIEKLIKSFAILSNVEEEED